MSRTGCFAVVLAGAVVAGCGTRPAEAPATRDALQEVLAARPDFVEPTARGRRTWEQTRRVYLGRGYLPAWFERGRATHRLDDLLEELLRAADHGLDPVDYNARDLVEALAAVGGGGDQLAVVRLDVRLTYAFLRIASDLAGGRVAPRDTSPTYLGAGRREDVVAHLERALASGDVSGTLASLPPAHPQYLALKQALAAYRATVRPGEDADPERAWAIRRIEMNMERWRWAPRDLGEQHILVNVPAYDLQAIEGYRAVLAMRVVVGEPSSPTPIFSDRMTYVVFSPYWNIPESILRREVQTRAAEDPDYIEQAGIEAVRTTGDSVERVDPQSIDWSRDPVSQGLRFRQVPGRENALGLVKFIFPNHFSVYLHDTPDASVFDRARRAHSHGCVRVEDPVALAEYVLRGRPGWDRQRIATAMDAGQEQVVVLDRTIPVHIGYWTVRVQRDGTLAFTDDPYGLDRRHDRAWRRAYARAVSPGARQARRPAGSDLRGARTSLD